MHHHRPKLRPLRHRHRRQRQVVLTNESFQLAPFIDVIFVLLLFYVVKIGFQEREGALRISLPAHQETAPPGLELQEEIVRIDETGALFHNEESVSLQELTTHFQGLQQQSTSLNTPLLVNLDSAPDASYAQVTRALEALQNAGVHSVTFNVDEE